MVTSLLLLVLLAFRLGTNILVFVTGNANNNTGKFDVPKCWMTFQIQIWDVKLTLLIISLMFSPGGNRLQNTKIPLAVNNVIPLLIGPSKFFKKLEGYTATINCNKIKKLHFQNT